MKNLAILVISCLVTWFAAKSDSDSDKKEAVAQIKQQPNHEDSVLNKIANTYSKLGEAVKAGDKKVVSTIEKAANTITSLKAEVGTLKEEVKQLTNENKTLKGIINNLKPNSSEPVKFLPIESEKR